MTLKALYDSVNAMMAKLGASGELHPRDATVTAVMDAMHDIDGGAWSDKVFVDKALFSEVVRVAEERSDEAHTDRKAIWGDRMRRCDKDVFRAEFETIERAKMALPEPPKGE